MKKFLFSAASLLILLGACSQNDLEEVALSKKQNVVVATIEGQKTRLNVYYDDTANQFNLSWSTGDAFKVFGGVNPVKYTWSQGDEFIPTTTPEDPTYAVYPFSENLTINENVVSMELSASPSVANINLPMWADASNGNAFSFKHLAAALQFTLNEIPEGYNQLIVVASNPISGVFTATLDDKTPILASTSTADADKMVTVSFEAATSGTKNQVFYIPLPVGTYTSLAVSVSDGDEIKALKSWKNLAIERGKMYYTTATVDVASAGALNDALANVTTTPTTVNLTEEITVGTEDAIEIPAEAENVTLNFEAAPTTTVGTPLVINQNEEAASGTATSELNITMPAAAEGLYATINAPTTTVTLEGGTYESLVATTATNTLIIGEGVTIKKLVVKGGNVVLKGNVENIESDDDTTINLMGNITLGNAITITKGNVTIDLNGYTIENKSANNTTQLGNVADECIVFYVDGADAKLTLNATNGGKVIATGNGSTSYYNTAVWVTNGATATINGGEYSNTADPANDGCDLIYGRDGGKIYVKGGTFKAGAIRSDLGGGIYGVLNCKDSKGSVITVSGGKFYEYGAAEAAKVGNGEVILLEGGYYWSAKDVDGYYTVTDKIETEEALRTAIANNNEVKLGANITLTDAITINKTVTIDLNGYTIENKSANNTTQLGNVADECIVFYVDGADAKLTLNATNGGKVIATGNGSTSYYNTAVWVTNGATATINGGEYSNTADPANDGCDLIYGRDGGKIYVKGGTFKAGAIRSDLGGGIYGVLNCKDSKGSVITVSGGKFYEYGAAEAAKVGNGEVILLEGGYYWSAKDVDGYYTVTDKIETEEALRTAIANNNEVKLGANITLTDAITVAGGKNVTINLNGKTIENKTAGHPSMISPEVDDECVVFMVTDGKLTIEGEGNVKATGDDEKSDYNVAVWVMGENAEAVISGGTYTNSTDTEGDGCDLIYGRNGAKITINGGSFQSHIRSTLGGGTYDVLDCKDYKAGSMAQSTITVNGGKFQNYVPSYENVGTNEVVLGNSKAVYNGVNIVTTKHDITAADVWYEVK